MLCSFAREVVSNSFDNIYQNEWFIVSSGASLYKANTLRRAGMFPQISDFFSRDPQSNDFLVVTLQSVPILSLGPYELW